MFSQMSDDALRALAQRCEAVELQAGETLLQQNDPGDALYMLEAGQIHIIRQYPDGEQVILATEGPYYVIGDLSMLAGQPRVAAVVAVSDCSLIALKQQAFAEVCEQTPDVAIKVVAYLAERLFRLNLQVRENAISNVAARIASVFWLLSGGEAGEIGTTLRVSRVARAAATDADTVERILREWAAAGYIAYDGRRASILDIDMIGDIAG